MHSKTLPYIRGWPKLLTKVRKTKNKIRYLEFLIDSGSDYTMIWQGDALLLGIDYKTLKGPEITAEVANFDLIHSKKVNLEININDHFLNIPVLITKEKINPLLGRKGVFEKFDVLFQESQQQVTFIKT